jgi:hypothetical protein
MNDLYTRRKTPLRREADHPKGWYRTLFNSYLYRPPVWVYVIELLVASLAVYVLLEHDGEVVSILIRLLSEVGA